MFRRPLIWFLLSLLLFAGAAVFWRLGDRWAARAPGRRVGGAGPQETAVDTTPRSLRHGEQWRLLSADAKAHFSDGRPVTALRLSNANLKPSEWTRCPTAILLENARIDTTAAAPVIPSHLRAQEGDSTFIVQSRGPINEAFRAGLRQAGATIVAYIPNNAYLVRVADAAAKGLNGLPGVQAVLPYEPYYKLKTDLLKFAVNQWEMPLGEQLNLAMFADARDAVIGAVVKMGAKILAEDPSPFGPVITVEPPIDSLVALASLPGVQVIEPVTERAPANDLGRARTGVAADTQVADSWLGLTGTNVMVNVNDSGVDATHPDLVGRMFAAYAANLEDENGHGTHVIGTIAGNGLMSTTVSNANGSIMPGTNGQFRGEAPGACVFVQHVSFRSRPGVAAGGPSLSDWQLQEAAARTNAFISNNSWHYSANSGYDLAAARYDAATRDAIPEETGSQPLLFVFAAGNAGGGEDGGQGGDADSIRSPGNAKNVITVGASEQLRYITNVVVTDCKMTTVTNESGTNTTVTNVMVCITNKPWAGQTDSDNEVAAFSSRGNVGVGVEGEAGRFKPDVVAPGTWVVSTRSQQWDEQEYFNPTNYATDFFEDLKVKPGKLRNYSIYLPPNAVQAWIDLLPNDASPVPFPGLPIFVKQSAIPTTNSFDFVRTNHVAMPPDNGPSLTPTDTSWNYSVGTTNEEAVWFNLQTTIATTNDNGNEFEVRSNLNRTLGPAPDGKFYYRYESGSSMSAAFVSGTLALMQEFFEQKLYPPMTNSPAMMKALLINGARSLARQYDFQVQTTHNYQGWGLVNLPTTLPALMTNYNPASLTGPMILFDQNPTNALATGDRHVRNLQLTDEARTVPLRVTLVWTDPPGNPAAGVKLVNDLDLVVTNLDTGEVYFGNDIQSGSVASQPWNTNNPANIDVVNNVENVFLDPILGTNYAIAVIGSRVNVNAVTSHTNDTVQDYALVISCGDGDVTDPFTLTDSPNLALGQPNVTYTTNLFENVPGYTGSLLLGQHVGANTPLMGITNGMTNQWHFYVLTNTENYTNAAFVTFLPYTLSIPRLGVNETRLSNATRAEADIDLYVSLNPAITNLDPNAIAGADKARSRGGTEVIVYSNAVPGGVYYVGVKSEDQMASEYGFLGVFSLLPFSDNDNGNLILRGFPVPTVIPDGSPSDPGATFVFALAVEPIQVRRVIVTNTVTHENFGDLLGNLSHNGIVAALNNHTFPPGDPPPLTYTTIYEDNEENDIRGAQRTDGPGSLRDFVGEEGIGLWLLQMVDDASSQTGRVDYLSIRLEPQMIDENGRWRAIQPYSFSYDFVDVPANASNLTVCVITTNNAPLELYVRRGDFPTRTEYDKKLDIAGAPGGCLTVDRADLPPLSEGRYYIGIYNPTPVVQFARLVVTMDLDLRLISPKTYTWKQSMPLTDEAVTTNALLTNAWLYVSNNARIASVEVGVRIDHERVSDLALTLVSPKGTRILLTEDRGWTNDAGFGSTYLITNTFSYSTNKTGPEAVTNVIDTGLTSGTLTCTYNFGGNLADQMTIYYEGVRIYDTGMTSDPYGQFTVDFGPGSSTLITIIMNEFGNPEDRTYWEYTFSFAQEVHNYVIFTENTNLTTTPMKFATPPFTPSTNRTVTFISGFEPAAAGDYITPQTFDGWTAQTTNPVTVVDDALNANTGTKYLMLRGGEILRTLPTTRGRDYRLEYAYRKPTATNEMISWWPGEGAANDIVDGNGGRLMGNAAYAAGKVGGAFIFDGGAARDRVDVGNPVNLQLQDFTIEAWVKRTSAGLVSKDTLPGLGGVIFGYGTGGYSLAIYSDGRPFLAQIDANGVLATGGAIIDTSWHHVAVTKTGSTVMFFVDGIAYPASAPYADTFTFTTSAAIGSRGDGAGNTLYGEIDELAVYGRALSAAEVQAIHAAGAAGKCGMATPPAACASAADAQVYVPGLVTNGCRGTVGWQTNAFAFTADADNVSLGVAPVGGDSHTWFDTFVLTEFPGPIYFLPEESLKTLADENAQGDWKLEILDTRVGATNAVPPVLISWQLRFVFQNLIPIPGVLLPGEAKTNTVPAGYIAYYVVDVPGWANFATNSLLTASGPVNLWFNQATPPFGTNTGDFLFLDQQTSGSKTLSASSTPPLVPGQRYYLGVQNTNTTSVTYALQVDFDVTPLTNGVSVTSLVDPTGTPRYFSYDVSTNANVVFFQLSSLSGDAQLVARRGAPLPTLVSYDYGSFNSGSQEEQILVLTNSQPVALSPGRWYLGVFDADTATVIYTITATEYTFASPIITLTNGVPYAGTAAGNGLDYYRYVVSDSGARGQFEINSPSGDLTLVARKGWPPPDLGSFDYRSLTPGTNDEQIVLFNDSSPVPLAAGEWFLTAANNTGTTVNYRIKATEWPVTGQPVTVTGASVTSTNFCLTWSSLPGAHYYVQGLTDLNSTNWVSVSPTITAAGYSTTWCLGLPSPYGFFRVTEGIVVAP